MFSVIEFVNSVYKLKAGALAQALPRRWILDSIDRNSFSGTATSAIWNTPIKRELTDERVAAISRYYGRDYSTVVYSARKVESEMLKDVDLLREVREITSCIYNPLQRLSLRC